MAKHEYAKKILAQLKAKGLLNEKAIKRFIAKKRLNEDFYQEPAKREMTGDRIENVVNEFIKQNMDYSVVTCYIKYGGKVIEVFDKEASGSSGNGNPNQFEENQEFANELIKELSYSGLNYEISSASTKSEGFSLRCI